MVLPKLSSCSTSVTLVQPPRADFPAGQNLCGVFAELMEVFFEKEEQEN